MLNNQSRIIRYSYIYNKNYYIFASSMASLLPQTHDLIDYQNIFLMELLCSFKITFSYIYFACVCLKLRYIQEHS